MMVLEGFLDLLTPPASIEALASAAGLPIAEPVSRGIPGLELQGIGVVALPAQDNLMGPDGTSRTGALIQFPDDDHYIIYFNEDARTRIFDFLQSSLNDAAVITP